MLSRVTESVGLHWRHFPSPEGTSLDDWFLGAQANRRQQPPVPFFPEVHEEVTRSRKAPRCFNGQGHRPACHGPPLGPPGQVIKQLHEGGADPGLLQELLTATDLRVTKVKAQSLGQTMSTLVVQERHLWLTLADMREYHFLDSHISQAGLFGEAEESFAQQFSTAQKQMEAFHHILPWRSAAVSTPPPAAIPPPAHRRGCPPAASTSAPARPQQQPSHRPKRGADGRKAGKPVSTAYKQAAFLLFPFCSILPLAPQPVVLKNSKNSFLFLLVSIGRGWQCTRRSLNTPSPSPLASGQQCPACERYVFSRAPCQTVEPGKCRTMHSDPTPGRATFCPTAGMPEVPASVCHGLGRSVL